MAKPSENFLFNKCVPAIAIIDTCGPQSTIEKFNFVCGSKEYVLRRYFQNEK